LDAKGGDLVLHRLLLGAAGVLLGASLAMAQPALTATSDAHPGDTVTWSVSGATAGAHVAILASGRNAGMHFGPITTPCGTIDLSLGIGPGFRFVGRGTVADDGTFTSSITLSSRLPARFDGVTIYAQAVTVDASRTSNPQSCTVDVQASNVATTTLHVP
jgi:hypothetical protein